VTLGHLMVVTHLLLNELNVDYIHVIPCFQQTGKNLQPFGVRMTMCRAAFAHLPRTYVDPIEEELGGESLTINLVRALKHRYPHDNLRFVMGADLLESAPTWQGWEEINRLAPPLIIGRAGITPVSGESPSPISPLVSASIVRKALEARNYELAERYIPSPALQIIQDHHLYTTQVP